MEIIAFPWVIFGTIVVWLARLSFILAFLIKLLSCFTLWCFSLLRLASMELPFQYNYLMLFFYLDIWSIQLLTICSMVYTECSMVIFFSLHFLSLKASDCTTIHTETQNLPSFMLLRLNSNLLLPNWGPTGSSNPRQSTSLLGQVGGISNLQFTC